MDYRNILIKSQITDLVMIFTSYANLRIWWILRSAVSSCDCCFRAVDSLVCVMNFLDIFEKLLSWYLSADTSPLAVLGVFLITDCLFSNSFRCIHNIGSHASLITELFSYILLMILFNFFLFLIFSLTLSEFIAFRNYFFYNFAESCVL